MVDLIMMQATDENNEPQTERERLYKVLPTHLQQAILRIPDEYLCMSESDLTEAADPGSVEHMLRYNLWKKFHEAERNGVAQLTSTAIFSGICTSSNWYNRVLQDPKKLAWILQPTQESTDVMREALDYGIRKIRNEILTQKVTEKNAASIIKAIQFLADRVWGTSVQRIESKNLNLNVGNNQASPEIANTREAIESKLLELQQMVKQQNDTKILEASKSIEDVE